MSDGGTAKGGYGVTVPAYTNPDGNGGLAQRYWNKKLYTGNDPKDRRLNRMGKRRWCSTMDQSPHLQVCRCTIDACRSSQ